MPQESDWGYAAIGSDEPLDLRIVYRKRLDAEGEESCYDQVVSRRFPCFVGLRLVRALRCTHLTRVRGLHCSESERYHTQAGARNSAFWCGDTTLKSSRVEGIATASRPISRTTRPLGCGNTALAYDRTISGRYEFNECAERIWI
jgi:hypothetical protein